jgi:hypothetical protein
MSTASRLAKLAEGLDSNGVLSADKGGTGNTTGGGTSSPTISTIAYVGNDTAADVAGGQTITLTGTNFAAGAKVLINTTQASVVTVVSSTQITFTTPALAAGSYILYVVNLNGSTAIAVPGIQYSGVPAWSTPAGTLGTITETTAVSATLSATSNSAVSYSLASGTLPVGATLNSNGTISGSSPLTASSTTYTFTVRATDLENQDTDRQFSLTINPDVVTWSSPANEATLVAPVGEAYSSALAATSAVGSSISYSTNSLPPGLSISGSTITGTPTTAGTSTTTLTATATATSRTAQITINWTINVASDAYWKNTSLLLSSRNTAAPFNKDASANNFELSVFGDTKPNNFNPYTPGYYSNYFDGNGDYWTAASNTAFNFGTGDFTIECWVYPIANGLNYPTFLGSVTGWSAGASGHRFNNAGYANKFWFGLNGSTGVASGDPFMASTNTFSFNTWHHYSVTRSGNTWRMFVNGVLENTQTYAGSYDAGYGGLRSGWSTWDGAQGYFTGYTSNLRLVKGTAVYTANFTPPTAPLTAISGTSLLTSQSNRFIDNSTNNFALTVTGDTSIKSFDPFVPNPSYSTYGSTYFDGTGDYLSVSHNPALDLGSGDFTVEFWLNRAWDNAAATRGILGKRASDSTSGWVIYTDSMTNTTKMNFRAGTGGGNNFYTNASPAIGIWEHWALVRTGTTLYWFKNGVIDNTGTSSVNITDPTGSFRVALADTWTAYASFSMADLRIVKGTAVYTANFTPPTAPLTAITNTSLLTLQNNQPVNNSVFLDNSSNNTAITRAGNTTQGTFSPYGSNWSNYFDGTGDYLTVGANANLSVGTSDFTIEAWVNLTSGSTYQFLMGSSANGGMMVAINAPLGTPASTIAVGTHNVAWLLNFGGAIPIVSGTWTHIAITRSGTTNRAFINGVQLGSNITDSTNWAFTSNAPYIACNAAATNLTGYISNLRVVKGTAIYTSAFTPSTTPLTPIANTALLTCADNRLIDDSVNNLTITKSGDVSVQRFSPFNPAVVTPTSYSAYFDGTGDSLTTPSNAALAPTGDFTIELWFYANTFANIPGFFIIGNTASNIGRFQAGVNANGAPFFYLRNNAGTEVTATASAGSAVIGNWYHIAVVRNENVYTMYLNGVSIATVTSAMVMTYAANICNIGVLRNANTLEYLNGYISNFRIVNGTTVYTSAFTPPTAPLTAVANTQLLTCQSPTFVDNSTNNFTLTVAGNTQPSQQNPFGFTSTLTSGYTPSTIGGSEYLSGASSTWLAAPINSTFAFGTNNYTYEAWVYPTSLPNAYNTVFCNFRDDEAAKGWSLLITSTGLIHVNNQGTSNNSTNAIALNTWTHIAVCRVGNTVTRYINGVADPTTLTVTASITNVAAQGPTIGGSPEFSTAREWNGYISDARVVNGTAIYTRNFVPPSAPLTAVKNTSLLLNMNSAGIYDSTMMTTTETVGDAKISNAVKKYNNTSMYFDGTGDYLTLLTTPNLQFGTGDFTIELWTYFIARGANGSCFIGNYNNYTTGSLALFAGHVVGNTSKYQVSYNGSSFPSLQSSTSIIYNQWAHLALVRSGTTITLYINGVADGTITSASVSLNGVGSNWFIGTAGDSTANYTVNGYIDDLRITKGYARYTANFTPPTAALLVK